MELKEIITKIREDIQKRETDPILRLENNSEKALTYSEILFRVKRQYNKEKLSYDQKYSEVFRKLKKAAYQPKNKQELEFYILEDNDCSELRKKVEELENIVKFLETLVDIYKNREASERLLFKYKTGETL